MNRRAFLNRMAVAVAVAAGDPSALLWKPGERRIFVPKKIGNYSQWQQFKTFELRRDGWYVIFDGRDSLEKLAVTDAGARELYEQIERGHQRARELGFL